MLIANIPGLLGDLTSNFKNPEGVFDSCIWRDHYENRFGPKGRPLGAYATKLVFKIVKDKDMIIISDLLISELKRSLGDEEIKHLFDMLSLLGKLKRVSACKSEDDESRRLAKLRNIPVPDALHAVIARNNSAILVTQDKHFQLLKDIVEVRKPEEVI